jgi:hypothetical protein
MGELDVVLKGKSLGDYTNTQLRMALGAVLYTNTADMWNTYLKSLGYTGSVSAMLEKYYIDYAIPTQFRNYITAGAAINNPQNLFTATDQGFVYDNNDLTSFYLDSAGTTPATVNGLVGLQFDKSKSLTLGAESVTNGGFDTDTAWTKGTGWAIGSGVATHTGGTAGYISQLGVTIGKTYKITLTITNTDGRALQLIGAFWTNTLTVGSTAGTYTVYAIASSDTMWFYANTAGTTISIDNISVKELPGNHRYQTTTGSKPILRGTPTGSNFFTNGDGSTTTGWTTDGVSTLASVGGRLRLTKAAAAFGYAYKNFTTVVGRVYLIKWKAYTGTAGPYFSAGVDSGAGKSYVSNRTTTGEAYFTATSTTAGVFIQVNDATASLTYAEFDDIEVIDASADAVTAPYGLQYDGIDDFLRTASVDFTATDKMAVVMGVRKLSDAAAGVAVSFGNVGATSGSFELLAPSGAGLNNYGAQIRGVTSNSSYTYTTYASPISNVVSLAMDYAAAAGSEIIAKINGATPTQVAGGESGVGPFANQPMYFGRRTGTILPFNGLDFGGVCIGKTLTATQLANVEKWVAIRTGVSL